jgi:hypothetical protein
MAGELAIDGATPLRYNGYEIPLMRNLMKRAIRGHWRRLRHEQGRHAIFSREDCRARQSSFFSSRSSF